MKAEIITVGDEILIGQIVDTNSAWIADLMENNGVDIHRIVSVSDEASEITEAMDSALNRADIVVMTGGLGPTKDDITKHTIARYFSTELVLDQKVYSHVEQMMTSRGIAFNESNQSQALVPAGCTVLHNANATAPGMLMRKNSKMLFSLPGVPFEMKALMTDQVLPIIKKEYSLKSMVHRNVITFGMAESVLSETIAPWEDALPDYLHLAYLPNPRGIRLRLSAYEVGRDEAEKEIELQFEKLRQIIPQYFVGKEPTSVEAAVADLLVSRGKTLAVAESCTGGSIASRITAMEGASEYFRGAIVAYSNDAKKNILGVSVDSLNRFGAVSKQVAEQMAVGALHTMAADYAIATTGIAGPTGGSDEKPVGTVWFAIAWEGGVESRMMRFGTLRFQNIERASTHALNMLRLQLLGIDHYQQNSSVL